MRRKYYVVCTALLLAAFIWTAGGCGGGSESSSKPVVYLDGNLHGDLAAQIAKQARVLPFHDTETDGTVIVSLAEGTELDAATEAGLKAAYDAGQVVAIEHASQSEMRDFLDAIGLERGYVTPEEVKDTEDDDLEIFAAAKSGDSVLTYTTHTDHHPAGSNDILYTSADFEDDAGASSDVDEEIGAGTSLDVTEDEANAARVAKLFEWIASKDAEFGKLAANRGEASAKLAVSGGDDDITKIANAYTEFHDCSEPGHVMHLQYTIYSCHNFTTGDDWYLVIQSGNLNPSEGYQRYMKYHHEEDPDAGNYDLISAACGGAIVDTDNYKYVVARNFASDYIFRNYILLAKNSPEVTLDAQNQSPTNVNKNSSKTVGMSWNLGGSLGISASGPSGGLSSGLSYSSSRTITTNDYYVTNNSCSSWANESQWEYTFTHPGQSSHHPEYRGLHDASAASTKNFIPTNEWVWRVSKDFRNKNMNEKSGQCLVTDFYWAKGKSIGAFGRGLWQYFCPRIDARVDGWKYFSVGLPVPPRLATDKYELKFNKSDSNTEVSVLSELDWTAAVISADWCTVGPDSASSYSGAATGSKSYGLLVEVNPNDSGSAREAEIQIRDVKGETVRSISVIQSRTN